MTADSRLIDIPQIMYSIPYTFFDWYKRNITVFQIPNLASASFAIARICIARNHLHTILFLWGRGVQLFILPFTAVVFEERFYLRGAFGALLFV